MSWPRVRANDEPGGLHIVRKPGQAVVLSIGGRELGRVYVARDCGQHRVGLVFDFALDVTIDRAEVHSRKAEDAATIAAAGQGGGL